MALGKFALAAESERERLRARVHTCIMASAGVFAMLAVFEIFYLFPLIAYHAPALIGAGIDPAIASRYPTEKVGEGRYIVDGVFTREQCVAMRELARAFWDDEMFLDTRDRQLSTSDLVVGELLYLVQDSKFMHERPEETLQVVDTIAKTVETARELAASLLGFPSLRFECTNFNHRWKPSMKNTVRQMYNAMGFHFDNCIVDNWASPELEAAALNASVPSSVLNAHCKKTFPPTRFREATTVVYFDDEHTDIEGGGTLLLNDGVRSGLLAEIPHMRGLPSKVDEKVTRVSPKCGRMAVFRSDVTNPHAVENLIKGDRYVIQLFMVEGLPYSIPFKAPSVIYTALEHAYVYLEQQQFFIPLNLHIQALLPSWTPWLLVFFYVFTVNYYLIVTVTLDMLILVLQHASPALQPARPLYVIAGLYGFICFLFPPVFIVMFPYMFSVLLILLILALYLSTRAAYAQRLPLRLAAIVAVTIFQALTCFRPRGSFIHPPQHM
eukprot:m.236103 g.236103  ORF g.236103 m.236103 type:complete len:496 (-) comp12927_c0_seq1:316-1803(-)